MKRRRRLNRSIGSVVWLVACLAATVAACGDDSSGSDAGGGGDTGIRVDSGGATDAGGSTDGGGSTDAGSGTDSGRVTGCAGDAGVRCPGDQMCCSGVPYPQEGVCGPSCPLDSDRAIKTDFAPVSQDEMLERLGALPIQQWSYQAEGSGVRHVGPMAQDFRQAFGLGADDRHIHPVDASGVTMAAVQALLHRVERLEHENASLRHDAARMRRRLSQIERPAR